MDKIKVLLGLEESIPIPAVSKKASVQNVKNQSTINLAYFKRATSEIKVISPRKYSDSIALANLIKADVPLIVNFQYLDKHTIKRVMDFISGTVYSLNGQMLKLSAELVIITSEKTLVTEETCAEQDCSKSMSSEEVVVNVINNN